MPEGRYSLLWKCHFVDNMSLPTVSNPGELTPESLCTRRTHCHRQVAHVVARPTGKEAVYTTEKSKFDFKSYELCTSSSGNIWNAIVHARTAMQQDNSLDGLTSSRIIQTLAKDLMGKGYCIFMDNWSSSPCLLQELRMKQTDAVGTVCLNRKHMPTDLKKKVPHGEAGTRFTNYMMAKK